MSGRRQTGTVPKTKHKSRGRRQNAVNHIPNNLDWHEPFPQQRARKESNTYSSHLSDTGENDWLETGSWGSIGQAKTGEDDELRWSNVKSSNITPERGYVDPCFANRVVTHMQQENVVVEERDSPSTSKEAMNRGRLKMKMEQSQRKFEELQHQQAALLTIRNKAMQQVKPAQMGELQQSGPPIMLRNKAKQVKPVQTEMERMANIEDRLQQEYNHFLQSFEREDASANLEAVAGNEQQVRKKLNELIAKKVKVDRLLARMESEAIPDGAISVSSEEGDSSFTRSHMCGDEEVNRRDGPKQDNRELDTSAAASFYGKEVKLEEVKNRLEQLKTLLVRVERLQESKSKAGGGDIQPSHHTLEPQQHHQVKNCPTSGDIEKLQAKKFDLEHYLRKIKYCPHNQDLQPVSQPPSTDRWPTNYPNDAVAPDTDDYSSDDVEVECDDGEVEVDESPVKLCSGPQNSIPKSRDCIQQNVASSSMSPKGIQGPNSCEVRRLPEPRSRQRINCDSTIPSSNNATLSLQFNQLVAQMERIQIMCQNMLEKQQLPSYPPPPQSWLPQSGYLQYMGAGPHWHQHQLLVNSLNQCCQLIWHQQREIAGLRQALAMLQEDNSAYKCGGGYGNNLNFDPGLLWAAQTSPQTLNNQVPPGNRANNYWDNFRSYSRQNLLSGRNKSNEGSIAESLPVPRPTAQTDNLRNRKENSNSSNTRGGNLHQSQRGSGGNNNSGRLRHSYNTGSNHKPDPSAVFSLEQSIYSELDTAIAEAERDPQILLQLLTQLKTLRSQHPSPYEDRNPPGFENDCGDLTDNVIPAFPNLLPRIDEPRNDYEMSKIENTIMEVSQMIERQEVDTFVPQFLEQIVLAVIHTALLDPHQDIIPRLEASLLKFQGARISQVADELLCVIASILTPNTPPVPPPVPQRQINNISIIGQNAEHVEEEGAVGGIPLQPPTPQRTTSQNVPVIEQNTDHAEEEGAVGGMPLQPQQSQRSSSQSVETELAEADQTQHNSTDNVEVFGIEEVDLLNVELDNQEPFPRDDNQEQPIQGV